ncbi:organic cation transporter protein-like [Maniola hyperantus]|uniref:organic cation transporter protein-like n=1 Tax=Aphantopus hyperantus TaxID=2795564 RepID=UPI00156A2853|nr:organic cation transporter protein-like [Maniola hyperantus]
MSTDETIEVGNKTEVKRKLDLDDVLADELGQLGKYQLVTILLATFPVIYQSISTGEFIFTTARISTRCLIPQCDGENPEYAPEWLLNAIPGTSTSSFDNCERYQNSSLASGGAGQCPKEWFDSTHTEPCEEYVYQNTLSIVYDFGLACNEWKRSQIGSIRNIGALLGQPIAGYISDRWGRRVALVINAFNTAWLGIARSFVPSYEWFLITEVLGAATGTGIYVSCYILVTELVGPKRRVIAGATISSIYTLGQVVLALVAWGVPDWRRLTRVLFTPLLLVVTYFWLLSESVRWLMSKGRYEEAEAILKSVAKMNKTHLSDISLQALRETAEAEKLKEKPDEPWLPIQVIRSPIMLLRCVVIPIVWTSSTLSYHGININALNLSGNKYLNYIYVALAEIPGYWTVILLLDRIGRKPVLIGGFWLCAGCQFAFAFIPSGYYGLSLTCYLVSKFAASTVITSVYVYTAELFPTRYRHSLFAFTVMISRIGPIVSPLTPALALTIWEHFPSVLFGSFALLSGLLLFLTPETLGIKLPDTMEEAEQSSSQTRK